MFGQRKKNERERDANVVTQNCSPPSSQFWNQNVPSITTDVPVTTSPDSILHHKNQTNLLK
jgi:hypothetical protein